MVWVTPAFLAALAICLSARLLEPQPWKKMVGRLDWINVFLASAFTACAWFWEIKCQPPTQTRPSIAKRLKIRSFFFINTIDQVSRTRSTWTNCNPDRATKFSLHNCCKSTSFFVANLQETDILVFSQSVHQWAKCSWWDSVDGIYAPCFQYVQHCCRCSNFLLSHSNSPLFLIWSWKMKHSASTSSFRSKLVLKMNLFWPFSWKRLQY